LSFSNALSGFEFFPLVTDDGYLALITSYLREPAAITLAFDQPAPSGSYTARELIREEPLNVADHGSIAKVHIRFGFDDAAKLVRVERNG
jgi:hypothetical protein